MSSDYASSVELLQRLDSLLAETQTNVKECCDDKLPKQDDGELLNAPTYTETNKVYRKVTSHIEANINIIYSEACHILEEMPTGLIFRLCSVGCGDGRTDNKILERITRRFPERKLHYVGIDTNQLSCQQAKLLLTTQESLRNVSVEIFNKDIEQISDVCCQPFDLVIGVHMIYYVSSLEGALSNIFDLVKPKGEVLLVAVSKDPYNELFHRFWLKEKKRHVCFSTVVMKCLDEMTVKYTVEFTDGMIDLSQCFEDGFKHPHQRSILDFIAQTKFERYPPLVAETCIEYLSSIAYGKPEQTLIASRQDVIIVKKINAK